MNLFVNPVDMINPLPKWRSIQQPGLTEFNIAERRWASHITGLMMPAASLEFPNIFGRKVIFLS